MHRLIDTPRLRLVGLLGVFLTLASLMASCGSGRSPAQAEEAPATSEPDAADKTPASTRTLRPVEAPPEVKIVPAPVVVDTTDMSGTRTVKTVAPDEEVGLSSASEAEDSTDAGVQLAAAMQDPDAATEIGLDLKGLKSCYELAEADLSRFPSRVNVTIEINERGTVDGANLEPHGVHVEAENCVLRVIGGIHLPPRTDGKALSVTVPIDVDKLRN